MLYFFPTKKKWTGNYLVLWSYQWICRECS